MTADPATIRPLYPIEQAFTFSNDRLPLSVVCILHLQSAPGIEALAVALAGLQSRHTLLRCGIRKSGSRYWFQLFNSTPVIPVIDKKRAGPDDWEKTAREALNLPFETSGPLMRCWLLRSEEQETSELVVNFHHAIIDGVSARLLLHELLSLYAGLDLPTATTDSVIHRFPSLYRKGLGLWKKQVNFLRRRLWDEWRYRKVSIESPIPQHSENGLISLRLPPAVSRRLIVRAGRENLSINSVLLAAMTKVWLDHRTPDQATGAARVLSFANLREGMEPKVSPDELGCFISMLQLTVATRTNESVWDLARTIWKALFQAGRQGDHFLMSLLSRHLVALAFRVRTLRLGVCALSFIGKLDLQAQYGPIALHDVHAFITNNQYGPEWSAFGKILFGSIGLDFTYLSAETTPEKAAEIAREIQLTLEKMAK